MEDPKEIFALKPLNGVDMEEITVAEIQHHLTTGSFTSSELTEWTLNRIEQVKSFRKKMPLSEPNLTTLTDKLLPRLRHRGEP
jgi:hypothetical protein